MEDRRWRRIAFENLANVLRYLDNCNDVKVGITDLRERVEVPLQFGISIQQVAQQAMDEAGQNIIRSLLAKTKENYVLPAGPDEKRSGKALLTWKEGAKT